MTAHRTQWLDRLIQKPAHWWDNLIQNLSDLFEPPENATATHKWDSLTNEEETYALTIDPLGEFLYDMREERGWELVQNIPLGTETITYKLSKYLREEKEDSIPGNVLRVRARRMWGCAGQRHAELILAFRRKIHRTLRQHCLVFPGTIWRESKKPHDILRIPFLYWEKPLKTKEQWVIDFNFIDPEIPRSKIILAKRWHIGFGQIGPDIEWGSLGRFVLLRKPAPPSFS